MKTYLVTRLLGILLSCNFTVALVHSAQIHDVAADGDIKALEQLLQSNPELCNAQGEFGMTPLHLAAREGHPEIIKRLLAAGAKLSSKYRNGGEPLHLAALNGKTEAVELLLNAGADVNAKDNEGKTPLFYATAEGHQDVMGILRKHGAKQTHNAQISARKATSPLGPIRLGKADVIPEPQTKYVASNLSDSALQFFNGFYANRPDSGMREIPEAVNSPSHQQERKFIALAAIEYDYQSKLDKGEFFPPTSAYRREKVQMLHFKGRNGNFGFLWPVEIALIKTLAQIKAECGEPSRIDSTQTIAVWGRIGGLFSEDGVLTHVIVIPSESNQNVIFPKTAAKGHARISDSPGKSEATESVPAPPNWPPLKEKLVGKKEVRVKNPNEFSVKVGIRGKGANETKGADFTVPKNGTASAFIPDGPYNIYFQYSTDPTGLYQGDSFAIKGAGVEIQIVKVVNGNYGIQKVK